MGIDISTNRITGLGYDATGNMTNDGVYNYTYDAEGRQSSGNGTNYIYDGLGRRVEKSNGTLYWYGAGNDVLYQTDLSGNNGLDYVFFAGRRLAYFNESTSTIYPEFVS